MAKSADEQHDNENTQLPGNAAPAGPSIVASTEAADPNVSVPMVIFTPDVGANEAFEQAQSAEEGLHDDMSGVADDLSDVPDFSALEQNEKWLAEQANLPQQKAFVPGRISIGQDELHPAQSSVARPDNGAHQAALATTHENGSQGKSIKRRHSLDAVGSQKLENGLDLFNPKTPRKDSKAKTAEGETKKSGSTPANATANPSSPVPAPKPVDVHQPLKDFFALLPKNAEFVCGLHTIDLENEKALLSQWNSSVNIVTHTCNKKTLEQAFDELMSEVARKCFKHKDKKPLVEMMKDYQNSIKSINGGVLPTDFDRIYANKMAAFCFFACNRVEDRDEAPRNLEVLVMLLEDLNKFSFAGARRPRKKSEEELNLKDKDTGSKKPANDKQAAKKNEQKKTSTEKTQPLQPVNRQEKATQPAIDKATPLLQIPSVQGVRLINATAAPVVKLIDSQTVAKAGEVKLEQAPRSGLFKIASASLAVGFGMMAFYAAPTMGIVGVLRAAFVVLNAVFGLFLPTIMVPRTTLSTARPAASQDAVNPPVNVPVGVAGFTPDFSLSKTLAQRVGAQPSIQQRVDLVCTKNALRAVQR